ncbi:MAG: hypothetical protein J6I58_07530 [Eubacterium sp.]|nr:hypothetical protein [Eubacterium sp.]MBR1772888.1 hypothetical protein [Eubacterium sp.]
MNYLEYLKKLKNDLLKKYRRFVGFVIVPILLLILVALTVFIVITRVHPKNDARTDEEKFAEHVQQEKERDKLIEDYRSVVDSSDYIIHALGGMNKEKCYINSIDTLDTTYQAGYRLFEADISFTSDDVLVLAHSGENNVWSENDWKLRLGQEIPNNVNNKRLCTYDQFMSFKIQGEYQATSLAGLFDYMEVHRDMYVMVDAGNRSYEDTLKYYTELVKVADGREDILNRLIAGGQTTEMVRAAREAYDFPLINLYYDKDEKREKELATPEKFVEYCHKNDIISYSVAKEVYTEEVGKVLGDSDLIGYVFTVNDKQEASQLRSIGADVIGTDYLWDE